MAAGLGGRLTSSHDLVSFVAGKLMTHCRPSRMIPKAVVARRDRFVDFGRKVVRLTRRCSAGLIAPDCSNRRAGSPSIKEALSEGKGRYRRNDRRRGGFAGRRKKLAQRPAKPQRDEG